MQEITLKAHAKINLTLEVTGRRADGYHTIKTIMQSVGLHDIVKINTGNGRNKISLSCSREDLPVDSGNLAYRAAEVFFESTGIPGGCDIDIKKSIPVQAGLAGGSADAAAVLRGLDYLYGTLLAKENLCKMGLRLGADVPFCVMGGTMLAEGIGEVFTALPALPQCWVVLCRPGFGISTAEAFKAFDGLEKPPVPDIDGMIAALEARDLFSVGRHLSNHLEAVAAGYPEIAGIKSVMIQCGALGTLMSGSGSAVFGLFKEEDLAQKAEKELLKRYKEVFLTKTV